IGLLRSSLINANRFASLSTIVELISSFNLCAKNFRIPARITGSGRIPFASNVSIIKGPLFWPTAIADLFHEHSPSTLDDVDIYPQVMEFLKPLKVKM